jgi:hypothetical protein
VGKQRLRVRIVEMSSKITNLEEVQKMKKITFVPENVKINTQLMEKLLRVRGVGMMYTKQILTCLKWENMK